MTLVLRTSTVFTEFIEIFSGPPLESFALFVAFCHFLFFHLPPQVLPKLLSSCVLLVTDRLLFFPLQKNQSTFPGHPIAIQSSLMLCSRIRHMYPIKQEGSGSVVKAK